MRTTLVLSALTLATFVLAGCAQHAAPAPASMPTLPPTPLHIAATNADQLVQVSRAQVIGIDPGTALYLHQTGSTKVQIVTLAFDSGAVRAIEQPAALKFLPGERVEVLATNSDGFPAIEPLPALPKPPTSATAKTGK